MTQDYDKCKILPCKKTLHNIYLRWYKGEHEAPKAHIEYNEYILTLYITPHHHLSPSMVLLAHASEGNGDFEVLQIFSCLILCTDVPTEVDLDLAAVATGLLWQRRVHSNCWSSLECFLKNCHVFCLFGFFCLLQILTFCPLEHSHFYTVILCSLAKKYI